MNDFTQSNATTKVIGAAVGGSEAEGGFATDSSAEASTAAAPRQRIEPLPEPGLRGSESVESRE